MPPDRLPDSADPWGSPRRSRGRSSAEHVFDGLGDSEQSRAPVVPARFGEPLRRGPELGKLAFHHCLLLVRGENAARCFAGAETGHSPGDVR